MKPWAQTFEDKMKAKIQTQISQNNGIVEDIQRHTSWAINRYESKKHLKERVTYEPEEAIELFGRPQNTTFHGNILLNEGVTLLWQLCATTGGTKWDNSNARLGVGDSSTAESSTQTGLQATTNKAFKSMDSGYPTISTKTCSWKSTFDGSDANFVWNEFTLVNAADDSGTNLNRKVSAQGTKQSGQTWELTLQISLS